MEQVIISMLGVVIALMLYLDRSHRADLRAHRDETQAQLKAHRDETQAQLKAYRDETQAQLKAYRDETQAGFVRVHQRLDQLTGLLMDLAGRIGRLEGRLKDQAGAAEQR
ncbi:MAG: hypothetical protein OXF64_08965 [bacterium]|nr:hypothetical protein [bacterium]